MIANFPLEKHMKNLEKSGQMLNWGVELGEFDLQFTFRTTMKGHALTDFVVECLIFLTPKDQMSLKNKDDNRLSTIDIDGFSNNHGSRTGVILESHTGYLVEHSVKFGFKASNNVVEYEAALAKIDLANTVKAKRILIKSNSLLVVGQSTREFEARKKSMKKYQEAIRKRMMNFDEVTFQQIPRSENEKVDALSKLVSTATMDMNQIIYFKQLLSPGIKHGATMEINQFPWMDPTEPSSKNKNLPKIIVEAWGSSV